MREHIPTQVAETVRIDVIDQLKGDKNQFYSYLKVKEGDKVEKGQLIATAHDGRNYRNIFSPVFGTVVNVVPLLGALSIVPDQVSSVVTAHIPGLVKAIRRGREVDLVGYGVVFSGLVGLGGESRGTLCIAGNTTEPWRPDPEAGELGGRVLVAGHVDETSSARPPYEGPPASSPAVRTSGTSAGFWARNWVSLRQATRKSPWF